MTRFPLAAALVLSLAAPACAQSPILGTPPTYATPAPSGIPNEDAVGTRIWAPGLDAGYNPQGLTVVDGAVYVAAYRSDARSVTRGPCRVFRIDPASGAETGHFDVPSPCGHAGGLAVAGDGRLYLADTHVLFAIDLDGAFGEAPHFRQWPLGPGLQGSLAASDRGAVWIGSYETREPGRLFRFDTAVLDRTEDGAMLMPEQASANMVIPMNAQGAAFDPAGKLWVARSGLKWGELVRLDPNSGQIERSYSFVPGIEGVAFDAAGRMWAASEAGVRHYFDTSPAAAAVPFYPLVFSAGTAKLK
jgi:sugar lactone lactonase YvrE